MQRVMPCATCRTRSSVSILTRPGGRVQLPSHSVRAFGGSVSILTRPGGRVQLGGRHNGGCRREFQSSPVPEDGCNFVPGMRAQTR